MNSTMNKLAAAACAAAVSLPAASWGAGFQINEHNAAATGRAGSVFATVKDASAVFYNPAGLVHTKGTAFQLGVSLIKPSGTYVGPGLPSTAPEGGGDVTQSAVADFVPVPNFYAARQLSEKAYVGLGVYLPYGLSLEWENPESFVGRTVIQSQSLRTLFITPAIALKLSDQVAVAVSVSLVPASVYLRRVIGATDNAQVSFPASDYGSEGTVELSGSAFGVGANAGVQVGLLEDRLKLGLSFRSAVGLDFSGHVDFQVPETAPAELRARFPDGDIRGEVTLPHSFAFGIGWDDGPLTIEASANLTLWQSYDELRIQFVSGLPQPSSASPREWEAAPTFRIGGEYRFGDYAARLGAAYDINPVPQRTLDPTLPDNDRIAGTAGLGGKWGPIGADVGYMLLYLPERDASGSVNFQTTGVYEARLIHVVGLTVGAEF